MESDDSWILGINYWPRRKAMYWWKDFDPGEVHEEFAQIATWGLKLVRVCLLWEDFQPRPDQIDAKSLANLRTVLDIAAELDLLVMPTLIVGNMSGAIWLPAWTLSEITTPIAYTQLAAGRPTDRVARDLYGEPSMLRAQARLADAVAACLSGHPALWGYDLANEIDAAQRPRSDDAGWLWFCLLAGVLKARDPLHPVTYGAHPPSLTERNGLRIDDMAPHLDILSMHGYPLYSDEADGPLDPEFVPFVTALTTALGGKPTMMQEFGLCTAAPGEPSHSIQDDFLGQPRPQFLASEEDAAHYYDAVVRRLHAQHVPGALAWCYADYVPGLWDRPPIARAIRERTFGLVRADGSEKPAVDVLRRAATAPLPPAGALTDPLNGMTADDYYRDPGHAFTLLYGRWRATRAQ